MAKATIILKHSLYPHHRVCIYLLSIVQLVAVFVVSDLVRVELLTDNSDLRLAAADELLLVVELLVVELLVLELLVDELRSRRGSRHHEDESELKTLKTVRISGFTSVCCILSILSGIIQYKNKCMLVNQLQ